MDTEYLLEQIREGDLKDSVQEILIKELNTRGVETSGVAQNESDGYFNPSGETVRVAESDSVAASDYEKIGGWLVLPAIGLGISLVIMPFGLISGMTDDTIISSRYQTWVNTELALNIAWFVVLVYSSVLFFTRRSTAPQMMVFLYVSAPLTTAFLWFEFGHLAPNAVSEIYGTQLFREVVPAFIWIPYFRVSKRVKATFVR